MFDWVVKYVIDGWIRHEIYYGFDTLIEVADLFREHHPDLRIVSIRRVDE